jgi:hypothetical protein
MKKVLSIVLSLAMVVCLMPSMAFAATTTAKADAAYSDTAGTACEGAVNVLTALGVVNGYTDGTYRPEQVVTRAEMAKLVVTALGVDKYATATTSQFYDMSAAEWAIPYVEYAANLNIVNGYGNGKFGPNDTVTYEQAVTMIVRALGYTDECKEMNGSWPAIYIQKATALGIFEDVVNGGATGADRGDVAIMLYNALDLPEVYADNDGTTQYKNGSEEFSVNGGTIKGVSMLSTLNKSGTSYYGVLSAEDADDAAIDVRAYVGAAGKIYKDKDGDVISIGDLKSEFLTGTVNGDGDELTVDGTVYTINDDALTVFKYTNSSEFDEDQDSVKVFTNGVYADKTYTKTSNGVLDGVNKNKSITVAAKVSGRTITNIFSVLEWNKSDSKNQWSFKSEVVDESDITPISSKQTLLGKDFKTNDDGDIDYTTFILTGVDSLDDIAEDNVVYVYADKNDKIRKVEVGTETVTGVLKSFSQGTVASTGDSGTQATFNIDGTSYKGTCADPQTEHPTANTTDPYAWTLSSDSDDVDIGDTVTAYLDATGKIYEIELEENASSDYAVVLESSLKTCDTKINDKSALVDGVVKYNSSNVGSDDNPELYIYTAGGDALTLEFAKDATVKIKDPDGNTTSTYKGDDKDDIPVGSIITYSLNSSKKIKSVTIKSEGSDPETTSTITAKGYIDGAKILDSAVIFTLENPASDKKGTLAEKYDDDDADIARLSALLDTEGVTVYATVKNSKGQIEALVIDEEASNDDVYYGIATEVTSIDSDDNDDNDREVTFLVNGQSQTYQYDSGDFTKDLEKNVFYAFKLDASGYIDEAESIYDGLLVDNGDKEVYLGYTVATNSGVKVNSNVVNANDNNLIQSTYKAGNADYNNNRVTLDSDVIYIVESGSTYAVGTKSDLTGADEGDYALFFDLDDDDDRDGVADLVIITSEPDSKDTGTNAWTLSAHKIESVYTYLNEITGTLAFGSITVGSSNGNVEANISGGAGVSVTATVAGGKDDGNKFKSGDTPVITATFTADSGYKFDGVSVVPSVSGYTESVKSKSATTVVVEYTGEAL